jgi:hypothetical protein
MVAGSPAVRFATRHGERQIGWAAEMRDLGFTIDSRSSAKRPLNAARPCPRDVIVYAPWTYCNNSCGLTRRWTPTCGLHGRPPVRGTPPTWRAPSAQGIPPLRQGRGNPRYTKPLHAAGSGVLVARVNERPHLVGRAGARNWPPRDAARITAKIEQLRERA